MQAQGLPGYMGKVLRVDLTRGSIKEEILEPIVAEDYLGGNGFGVTFGTYNFQNILA